MPVNNNNINGSDKEQAKIACLPGFTIPTHLAKSHHGKSIVFDSKNGYPIVTKLAAPRSSPLGDEQQLQALFEQNDAALRYGQTSNNPNPQRLPYQSTILKTIEYEYPPKPCHISPAVNDDPTADKAVLKFDGFVRTEVPDGVRGPMPGSLGDEANQYIIRHVVINYYPEDGSISLVEPPINNSGLVQGVILSRQMVPKAGQYYDQPEKIQFFSLDDLQLGKTVELYGIPVHIVGCDEFTVKYAGKHFGIQYSPKPVEAIPSDPYLAIRNKKHADALEHAHHVYTEAPVPQKLKRFIENDRKVLRFYVYWDDRQSMFGEIRPFIVHYFLVDDTIEIREVQQANSGRDSNALLARRQKIPIVLHGLEDLDTTTPMGAETDITTVKKFVNWSDFKLGANVNLLNRRFIVYDCDQFTRDFLLCHGFTEEQVKSTTVELEDPRRLKQLAEQRAAAALKAQNESENQFFLSGSTERKTNVQNLLKNDGKVLRFKATMHNASTFNQGRQFVVSYDLGSDTFAVFEPSVRKLGSFGSKFAERASLTDPSTGKFYEAKDLYVGMLLNLEEADEFVFNWMETNKSDYPQSNYDLVLKKATSSQLNANSVQQSLTAAGINGNQCSRKELLRAIQNGSGLNEHEIITLSRRHETARAVVNIPSLLAAL